MMEVFLEFSFIVALATGIAILMRFLKQPLIVGYILTGILISPQLLDLVHTKSYIELFSKIGITVLLFIVGLNLSPRVIKEVGKASLLGGLGQIFLTTLIGYGLAILLGFSSIHALYIGISLSFSSTIIILKLLSDKGDLQRLYGKLSVGILLIQDLVAIVILILISSLGKSTGIPLEQLLLMLVTKAVLVFFGLYLLNRYVLHRVIHYLASSTELLFLFAITCGLGLACIFYLLGFSIEVGALIAGVMFALTPYSTGIASRLKPLRDFFIVLFFVVLGSEIVLSTFSQILIPAIVLSLFVLVGKPFIIFLLMNLLGFKSRPGFLTGTALAQVSEFSLILVGLGLTYQQIDEQTLSLITFVALITIAGSSYLVNASEVLYKVFYKYLVALEIKKNNKAMAHSQKKYELVLFGFDHVGHDFVDAFAKFDKNFLVVDLNPELIKQLEKAQLPFQYGDAEDIEFLQELDLEHLKLCVSTIPYYKANSLLVKKIRAVNSEAIIIVRSHEVEDAKALYEQGATYVVMPHHLGAQYAADLISLHGLDADKFKEEGRLHLSNIHERSNR